jgi:hypothetical protein
MSTEVREVATISVRDQGSKDEAVVIVRGGPNLVGLALSLRQDGDIEVFLNPPDAARVIDALQRALAGARGV